MTESKGIETYGPLAFAVVYHSVVELELTKSELWIEHANKHYEIEVSEISCSRYLCRG